MTDRYLSDIVSDALELAARVGQVEIQGQFNDVTMLAHDFCDHRYYCAMVVGMENNDYEAKCDCGLEQAIDKAVNYVWALEGAIQG